MKYTRVYCEHRLHFHRDRYRYTQKCVYTRSELIRNYELATLSQNIVALQFHSLDHRVHRSNYKMFF